MATLNHLAYGKVAPLFQLFDLDRSARQVEDVYRDLAVTSR